MRLRARGSSSLLVAESGAEPSLFRAAAWQAGDRQGVGSNSNYQVGNKGHIVLSLNGLQEDRQRIIQIISSRNYPIQEEDKYLQGEFNKAFLNIINSSLGIVYAFNPDENRLQDVRVGDLLAASHLLKEPIHTVSSVVPGAKISEDMAKIGSALIRVAQAKGAYLPDQTFLGLFGLFENWVAHQDVSHVSSSFKTFKERLFDPRYDQEAKSLLPTQSFLIEPLIRWADEEGDNQAKAVFEDLKNRIITVQQKAIEVRDNLEKVLRGFD